MANDIGLLFEYLDKAYPNYKRGKDLQQMGFDILLIDTLRGRGLLESQKHIKSDGEWKSGDWSYRLRAPDSFNFLLQKRINNEIIAMNGHTKEMKQILSQFKNITIKSSKTATKMTWITIVLASLTLLLTATQLMMQFFPINSRILHARNSKK